MEFVKFNLPQFLTDLETLVAIDSGSRTPSGTKKIADFFDEKFSEIGWSTKKLQFADDIGPCLEVSNTGDGPYDVLLAAHMDTVFDVGTASERPFVIKDGVAYGPGVIDMKANCLMTLYAVKELIANGALQGIRVCVAFNSEEEIGSRRVRPWLEALSKKSRCVFVMEGARQDGALVSMRKGGGHYSVTFTGRAAHAGVEPEKGINAITELGHWIVELQKLNNYAIGTSVNVGVVQGGTVANVVPEKAYAEVDFRFTEYAEAERIQRAIDTLGSNIYTKGVEVEVTGGVGRPPMLPNERTTILCRAVEQVGADLGIPVHWAQTGGGSDGNFSAALGVPTIDGLGPVGGNAHSDREYLEIDSIEPRLNLLCGSLVAASCLEL